MTVFQISKKIKMLNKLDELYRAGTPRVPDKIFDKLEQEIREEDPSNDYFKKKKLTHAKTKSEKEELPFPMFSMEKLKTEYEIAKWISKNNLLNEDFIITPKFDGLSLLSDEFTKQKYTRGDGVRGHNVTNLFSFTNENINAKIVAKYFGEGMIMKSDFEKKWSIKILAEEGYKNSRNMVASLFNPDTKVPLLQQLKDVYFIRYGCVFEDMSKEEEINDCNCLNRIPVPFIKCKSDSLTENYLSKLYLQWSQKFDIDGVIIDVNKSETRHRLGRESNGNPKFARAYKGNFEEIAHTYIKSITPQVSKDGYLTPVAQIEPVELDGATIYNLTLYNYRFVKDNNLGVLAKIAIKRSGGVIPKFLETIEPALEVKIPKIFEKTMVKWDKNEVELMLDKRTPSWDKQEILHFFRTFDVDEFGLPTVEAFYNGGFTTVKKILKMIETDIVRIEGFASRKAKLLLIEFAEKIRVEIKLSKLMAASNFFSSLGEKTLQTILVKCEDNDVLLEDLIAIDGIGVEKAKVFINNIDKFWDWHVQLSDLIGKYYVKEKVAKLNSTNLEGQIICFTGFRDKELEKLIVLNGGKVYESIKKETTMLIVSEYNSGSSKETKAISMNIQIISKQEFENNINLIK